MPVTIIGKEAVNLRVGRAWEGLKGGYLKGDGGRKGRKENDIILFQLKMFKHVNKRRSCGV